MSDKTTTIALSETTRDELFRRKERPSETYDEVVQSLLNTER